MSNTRKLKSDIIEKKRLKLTVELLKSLEWKYSYQVPIDSQQLALKLVHQSKTYYLSEQFCKNGEIIPILEKYIPKLRNVGDLNAIIWLYNVKHVVVHQARAEHSQYNIAFEHGIDVHDAVVNISSKQSESVISSPMSLIQSGDIETFKIFFEDWHNPDYREISTSKIDWFKAWLELYLEQYPR